MITYIKYIIDMVRPDYFSPAIEMNMPFTSCPSQKAAWIAWYTDVHIAIESAHNNYLTWLLNEAQNQSMEAVIWWLNRDYLDDAVTGNEACPCVPTGNSTCLLLDQVYNNAGGDAAEYLFRIFGNMGLRYHNGAPRPDHEVWRAHIGRPFKS